MVELLRQLRAAVDRLLEHAVVDRLDAAAGTRQTLHVLAEEHDDRDVERHEVVQRHVDHLIFEIGDGVGVLREMCKEELLVSASLSTGKHHTPLAGTHATMKWRVHIDLQITLDTSQPRSKLGILHNGSRNPHIEDFGFATIVQRNEINGSRHFAQLAGKRTQNCRSCLKMKGNSRHKRQSEEVTPKKGIAQKRVASTSCPGTPRILLSREWREE